MEKAIEVVNLWSQLGLHVTKLLWWQLGAVQLAASLGFRMVPFPAA
jgi:hypothetical protein